MQFLLLSWSALWNHTVAKKNSRHVAAIFRGEAIRMMGYGDNGTQGFDCTGNRNSLVNGCKKQSNRALAHVAVTWVYPSLYNIQTLWIQHMQCMTLGIWWNDNFPCFSYRDRAAISSNFWHWITEPLISTRFLRIWHVEVPLHSWMTV